MRYNINYISKGGSNPNGKVILEEAKITEDSGNETDESYNFKEEYIKNNVVPNEEGLVGIVLNGSYGGFSISAYAVKKLGINDDSSKDDAASIKEESDDAASIKEESDDDSSVLSDEIDRFNPALVKLVEDENEDGKINGSNAKLYVEYIPFEYYEPALLDRYSWDGEYFRVHEYDGAESIILNRDKMNIIKLLIKIHNVVDSEKKCEKKIQILEDILNLPEGKEFTIGNIVEHSKFVTGFGEEYERAKERFEEDLKKII